MFITKTSLPRRTFLHGMGTMLALPLFDAMVPAASALAQTAARPVRRLGFVYIPMGANAAQWVPSGEGRMTELSPSLASLVPFIDQVTVISNLELRNAYTTGNHASANCAFLSCAKAKRTEGTDYELGITVDQIAAQAIGRETPIPSLELGTDLIAQVGNCDNGFACAYQNNLSWSSPTTPLPTEADPRVVFERLFGDGGPPERRRADLQRNGSILDWMTTDMARLRRQLGAADRTRLAQYLDSVREVERRIQRAEKATAEGVTLDLDRPATVPAVWEDHVKLMFDLQVLALQTDTTRVITFQMARETSTRTYPHIGVPEPHHPVSHHTNDPEKLAKLAKINAHHVSLFAYLVQRLKETPDGDGSLLDHSMYLLGSGMGNPDVHDHSNLPIVVAGGGAGRLRGGRHVKYAEQTPLANLHLTLLDKVGVHLDRFVDSTGRVAEVQEPLNV
ncbi:MAG: DUF1552 domain-containing protein [Acidobacteria bacterium]|nr:DUF1552 domain-containing protein [Acidobacteriota bacterium]